MIRERLNYIDIAKAFAVIAMVSQHVEMSIENTVPSKVMQPYAELQNYIFLTWFMAVFFVITGYCSNYKKPFKPFITSLIISIGLPLLFFDIVPKNIENFTSMAFKDAIFQIPLTFTRFFRYSFWFLRALFAAKIIYWMINKYTHGYYKVITLLFLYLLATVAVVNGHGAHGCHSLIAIMLIEMGCWLKKHNILENDKFCVANLLAHVICMTSMWALHYQPPFMIETLGMNYIDIIWLPIVSFTGCVSVLYLCKKIGKCWILEFVGKYSLVVYCFHYYVNRWLNLNLSLTPDSSLSYSMIYLVVHVIITVTLCCIFAYIVDRPYLRVIIGKKP